MSPIAANKRRLSITFNGSPTRPIPIFSELNRDHQSRTAGRRRKRSFPFVPSTTPLYCIRSLANRGSQTETEKREREREHRIKSRPQATRLRLPDSTRCPLVFTGPSRDFWRVALAKSSTRIDPAPSFHAERYQRAVSNKQKCFEDDNRRGLESDSRSKEVGFAAMWDEIRILESSSRWNWGKSRDGERERESYITRM